MTIEILGAICNTQADKETPEDFCVSNLKERLEGLEAGEPIELVITSCGGDVLAGNAMIGMLRKVQSDGHRTTARVVGIAASMASAIACACDDLQMESNACLMIHRPWSCVQGNSQDLRREAQVLETLTKTLVSVYKTKFDRTDDEIVEMLDAETWILGSEAGQYGLNCGVIEVESDTRYAARIDTSKYGWINTPKDIMQIEEEKKPDPVEVTEEVEKEETPVETPVEEEKPEEETPEEDPRDARIAELEKLVEDLQAKLDECTKKPEEDSVPKAEVDKRVSGMQSKMQAQVNDFKNQLVAKDEELNTVKAELTSLTSKLSETEKELRTTASALEERNAALATLNADVNASPVASKPSGWGDLTGKAFKNYLKANNNILKITNK